MEKDKNGQLPWGSLQDGIREHPENFPGAGFWVPYLGGIRVVQGEMEILQYKNSDETKSEKEHKMKTFEEFREEHPNVGAIVSIKSDGVKKDALVNSVFCEKIDQAILKNKKFRAVLEYDPEELNSTFYIEFDEPGILLEVYPTKEEAKQASQERVQSLSKSHQQSELSKIFCEKLLGKCENGNVDSEVMGERNEWIRMMGRLERINDLPDIGTMEKIKDAFQECLIAFIQAHGSISGCDAPYLISDGIRNLCILEEILERMRRRERTKTC